MLGFNLKNMKVFVTKQGSEMPSNRWVEGQEINCHENIAADFIKRGIATEFPSEITSESKEEPLKTKKKK